MRTILFVIAALGLTACAEPPAPNAAAAACSQTVTHNVTWSQSDAPDVITAHGEGPSCKQAVVTFVARNAQGDPLWTFASTYYDLKMGGIPPEGAAEVSEDELQRFLTSWADVTEIHANELPEWREDMSRPGEGVEALGYETPFDREVYEAMRTRNLPTICYAAAVAAVQCLIIDPASHAPTMIVAYGS
jgi:hypothetical protein